MRSVRRSSCKHIAKPDSATLHAVHFMFIEDLKKSIMDYAESAAFFSIEDLRSKVMPDGFSDPAGFRLLDSALADLMVSGMIVRSCAETSCAKDARTASLSAYSCDPLIQLRKNII